MLTFGLKVKKKKKGRKLPRTIISTIKAKNVLARQLHRTQQHSPQAEIDQLQCELDMRKRQIKDSLCDVQLQHRHRLRSKTLRADPSRKKFWRFLKSQIKSAGSISAVNNKDGIMVFEAEDIEDAVLQHFATIFAGQRCPVYTASPQPQDQVELSILELDRILANTTPTFDEHHFQEQVCPPYSFVELEEALEKLPNGKASGYDRLPNELLKHSSFKYKLYLQSFLNKVLEEGTVPEGLNVGKCMLIHKVRLHHEYCFPLLFFYFSFFSFVRNFYYFSLNHFYVTLQGGDTLDTAQYRPITIPSNILRLITVRMCARMTRAAEENGLLGPEQFGFRKGRSTMDAVFVLTTMMKKAMKNR